MKDLVDKMIKQAILEGINDGNKNSQAANTNQNAETAQSANTSANSATIAQTGTQQTNTPQPQTPDNTVQNQNQNQQQANSGDMQSVKNKFNEVSEYVGNIDNSAENAINNAIKYFASGVTTFTRCSNGFDNRYTTQISGALKSFEAGDKELKNALTAVQNLKKLSQNINKMTDTNQQQVQQ